MAVEQMEGTNLQEPTKRHQLISLARILLVILIRVDPPIELQMVSQHLAQGVFS